MGSGTGHTHLLFVHEDSHVHRLRPECKVLAAVLYVLAVVATPREAFWAFACHALVLSFVAGRAGVPAGTLVKRLGIELPFVAFAFLLPFVSSGPRIEVLGLGMSSDGLWAAWNLLAKATLGVAASIVLASSTPVPQILRGLERLRLPLALTSIAGFMVRYLELIAGDLRRMRIARESRGYDPGWLWQGRAIAASAGTLFLRSYERGERVYLAMLSRGFAGAMPVPTQDAATPRQWAAALSAPATAAAITAAAWIALL